MMHPLSNSQHQQVEELAHQLWEDRRPLGSPDEDWFRAEQELIRRSDWPSRLPLSSLKMGPAEW